MCVVCALVYGIKTTAHLSFTCPEAGQVTCHAVQGPWYVSFPWGHHQIMLGPPEI